MKTLLLVLSFLLAVQIAHAAPTQPGQVRFFNNANWGFDPIIDNATIAQQDWMNAHYYRMLTSTPYFDSQTAWYPNGLAYVDAYAIYVDDPLVNTHPEWIMHDAKGNKLYIPWACNNGACTQFAGDFSNSGFRQYMIQTMKAILAQGYRGLWLDDVNFTWRVGDGYGTFVAPIDKNTGTTMTLDNWRLYLAQYMELIRTSFPNAELAHNVIWFADTVSAQNPYINREIDAADYINLERGGNDAGLVGGNDQWGYETFLQFIDYVHSRGADIMMMDIGSNPVELEYGLATWFLVSQGNDLIGNNADNKLDFTAPNSWWTGYNLNLGAASTARYTWNNVLRRDFACGSVLVNQPDMATQTLNVGSGYKNLAGQAVTTVTLAAKQAAILTKACNVTPAVLPALPVTINFQQGLNSYTGAKDTSINSAQASTNRVATTLTMQGGTTKQSTLLAWNVSAIPATAKIQKVDITLNTTNASANSYPIYEMKKPWVENQATWRNYATGKTWTVAGAQGDLDKGSIVLGTINNKALGQQVVSLNGSGIALVQAWVKSPSVNNGLLVLNYAAADNLIVNAKEVSKAANRPKLTVTYTLP